MGKIFNKKCSDKFQKSPKSLLQRGISDRIRRVKQKHSMPALPPKPSILLESLRHMGYTLKSAIADIIDNSISAGATNISVQFRGQSHFFSSACIAICDNGCGMLKSELLHNMKFGSRDSRSDESRNSLDLGRFGLGLKMASISQCRRLTVFSWKNGTVSAFCWDLDKIGDDWEIIELSTEEIISHKSLNHIKEELTFSVNEHGTIVLWENLDRENTKHNQFISETMEKVREHISLVFHRFMKAEQKSDIPILFDMNNMRIEPMSPFGPDSENRYILNAEVFRIKGHKVVYQPYILPRCVDTTPAEYEKFAGNEGYLQNQGFYVYRNKRLIERATWFNKRKKEYKTQLLRIQIDIPAELDDSWAIDVKKSQTSPPMEIQERVLSIVEEAMKTARQHWDSHLVNVAKLPNDLEPLWEIRQISSNRNEYKVNLSHPLLQIIRNELPAKYKDAFLLYLDSLSANFPYERYYSDRCQMDNSEKELPKQENLNKLRIMKMLEAAGASSEEIQKILTSSQL